MRGDYGNNSGRDMVRDPGDRRAGAEKELAKLQANSQKK